MSRSRKKLLIRIGFAIAFLVSGCSAAIQIDVSGGWDGDLTWTEGPAAGLTSPFFLDLTQDGKDITGTVTLTSHSTNTYTITITYGRAKSSSVELTASGYNDQISPQVAVSFEFDGDANDTQMSGTGTATIDGTAYDFTWEAVLVSAPVAES